jgi:hypothetical protein
MTNAERDISRKLRLLKHARKKGMFLKYTAILEFQKDILSVEDKELSHVYIKPGIPQLNGKGKRSHITDQEEFYQLLTYTDDVGLTKKLV